MTATAVRAVARRPHWPVRRWVLACAVAEAVGMTAAAGAAQLADRADRAALALGLVVAGGLVEGTALGVLQGRVIRAAVGPSGRRVARRWAVATVLVAGLGWAAASAPSVLGDSGAEGGPPPAGLVLVGAAALGAVMGAVLGGAQAWALRGAVSHPHRWTWVSALAWTPAMAVIFGGATVPDGSWSATAVVLDGTVTGLLAGSVLGLVSGALLHVLDGDSPVRA